MKWIGLTGGIACGKSTVAGVLRHAGVPVVCADELAREAIQIDTDGYQDVIRAFGREIVHPDGSLDRKALGGKVFGHPEKLRQLEMIIHPRVRALQRQYRRRLEAAGHAIAFYDVPLLFEKNLDSEFDTTIAVICDEQTQRRRLMDRDGLAGADADKRIASQLPLAEKARRAGHVLENNGTVDELRASTLALLERLRQGTTGLTTPTSNRR
jgi:dephospho-CoA kinase